MHGINPGPLLLLVSIILTTQTGIAGSPYQTRLDQAVLNCEAIPAMQGRGGLLLNPDGYRSFYEKSACFQRLAIEFRQDAYCDQVFRRYSPFSSSWGYSEENCHREVDKAIEADQSDIRKRRHSFEQDPVRITDFELVRDGNGRDYNLIPRFTAGYNASYTVDLLVRSGIDWVKIYSNPVALGHPVPNVRLYIRQSDVQRMLPSFRTDQDYDMALQLTVSTPTGRAQSIWRPAWIESEWPEEVRIRRMEKRTRVKAWQPSTVH